MVLRSVESSLAQVLGTKLGASSGPSALDIVRFNKSISTYLKSTVMFLVDRISFFDKSRRMLSFTLAKTG